MTREFVINLILFSLLGFYLAWIGHTLFTKEYWIILGLVLAIYINKENN